jgi:inorganic pyrophosphatase
MKTLDASQFINRVVTIEVDRPLGSRHPEHNFYYSVNYGFLPGVPGQDGEELDAYLLGVFEPVRSFTGRCIAIIQRLDDEDDKLVIVPEGQEYSDEQIIALTEFVERSFEIEIIRKKPK